MNKKILNKKYLFFKRWFSIENNKYFLIGLFFLFLQLFVIWGNYSAQRYDVFFWFCNHTPIIFAFAFFFRSKDLIKALINVGFIAQFLWSLDFFFKLFFNFYIFKVTRYVFEDSHGIIVLVPILIHVISTNLALYFTYKKRPNLKVLFYSLIYIMFLYATTLSYTLEERNVNCVYLLCGATNLTFSSYTYFWPVLLFFVVVFPTHGIQYLIYKHSIRKKN
jgi:hypothetical protein